MSMASFLLPMKLKSIDPELISFSEFSVHLVTDHPGFLAWQSMRDYDIASIMSLLDVRCLSAGLKECKNSRCLNWRKALDKLLPPCEGWTEFRSWILTASSCQMAAAAVGDTWLCSFNATQFQSSYRNMMMVYCHDEYGKVDDRWFWQQELPKRKDLSELFQVREIIYLWVSQIQKRIDQLLDNGRFTSNMTTGDYGPSPTRRSIFSNVSLEALEKATSLRLCPQRLWSLIRSIEWADNTLPALVDVIEKAPHPETFAHLGHERCSAQFCELSQENSTLKKQLHKCNGGNCRQNIQLDLGRLSTAVHNNQTTAWPIADLMKNVSKNLAPSYPNTYIAVSHVWSDGTGVGIGKPGDVNECLLSYFVNVATQLNCDGIWWDTICIPLEKEARRIALSLMHQNYENAKHTVIHDEYLLQTPWAEDGSPAVALVLSPWFTRGWTALELSVSQSVKVIYGGPKDPKKHVLKDLDTDILPQSICSIGHQCASEIIQHLRGKPASLASIFKVLGIRTTSWARDRIMIAALLARTKDFDYSDSQTETMRKILVMFRQVPLRFLLHGHVTLARAGGCSWCPSTVLSSELSLSTDKDEDRDDDVVDVDHEGAACVTWYYHTIEDTPVRYIKPHSLHPSVELRIYHALQTPENCFLLNTRTRMHILVQAAGLGKWEDSSVCIDCHYVGCVNVSVQAELRIKSKVSFRIGCTAAKPHANANVVLQQYVNSGGKSVFPVGYFDNLSLFT